MAAKQWMMLVQAWDNAGEWLCLEKVTRLAFSSVAVGEQVRTIQVRMPGVVNAVMRVAIVKDQSPWALKSACPATSTCLYRVLRREGPLILTLEHREMQVRLDEAFCQPNYDGTGFMGPAV